MAKFATKALIVAALVCLVFDGGCAEETLDKIVGKIDTGKIKSEIKEYATQIAITASKTADKVKDVINESEIGKKLANKLEKPITQMKDLSDKTKKKLHEYKETAKTTINKVENEIPKITKETKKVMTDMARTAKVEAEKALKKVKKEIDESSTLKKIHEKLAKSKATVKKVIGGVESLLGTKDNLLKRLYTAKTVSELIGLKGKSKLILDKILGRTRNLTANFSYDIIDKLNIPTVPPKRKKVRSVDSQSQSLSEMADVAKVKVTDFMKSAKQSASETYTNFQESENTKKVGSQLSSFFTNAFSKIKSKFTSNPDDVTKQEAIKAFDDYAIKHS